MPLTPISPLEMVLGLGAAVILLVVVVVVLGTWLLDVRADLHASQERERQLREARQLGKRALDEFEREHGIGAART